MSNVFSSMLLSVHQAKDEAIRDMTNDLKRKHPDHTEPLVVQEVQMPGGTLTIRVSMRQGLDDIDWQTATITPSIATNIVREPTYPDGHPNKPKEEEAW